MKGYFVQDAGLGENPTGKGALSISVTNIKEFNDLVIQAKKEARQLNETIDKLQNFQLNIEFSTDKTT